VTEQITRVTVNGDILVTLVYPDDFTELIMP